MPSSRTGSCPSETAEPLVHTKRTDDEILRPRVAEPPIGSETTGREGSTLSGDVRTERTRGLRSVSGVAGRMRPELGTRAGSPPRTEDESVMKEFRREAVRVVVFEETNVDVLGEDAFEAGMTME